VPSNAHKCSAKGDRQAAAASNCQFLGRITVSMACTMPFVAKCSQRGFADQLSSYAAEGAEDAPYMERVRCAKKITGIFARLLVSTCKMCEARGGFRRRRVSGAC
jgi:hypothetical protein